MERKMSLEDAYDFVLGGVLAISPELYNHALDRIAEYAGRINDDKFKQEIREIESNLKCDWD